MHARRPLDTPPLGNPDVIVIILHPAMGGGGGGGGGAGVDWGGLWRLKPPPQIIICTFLVSILY